jgi:hypothetical protein
MMATSPSFSTKKSNTASKAASESRSVAPAARATSPSRLPSQASPTPAFTPAIWIPWSPPQKWTKLSQLVVSWRIRSAMRRRHSGSSSRARNSAREPALASGGKMASPVVDPAVYGYMFSIVGMEVAASASMSSSSPMRS